MRLSYWTSRFALLTFMGGVCTAGVAAQTKEQSTDDPDRRQALLLYDEHKMPEAAALLEKVSARRPNDAVVHEALGTALLSRARTQADPAQRKADRLHARAELLRAKELGDNSDLCRVLLSGIPEDGGDDITYSPNNEVQEAMNRGEAAFSKGDFDNATQEYSLALEIDPKLYHAALYIGDMYFRQKKM